VRPLSFLIDGARGPLHAVYYPPVGQSHPLGDLLFIPPFGEEMNRCRAMAAMQARALASVGAGTLFVDPYGTGDSAGDFVEASWDQWREDLKLGIAWLRRHGQGCRALWGIRIGALMGSQLAREDGAIDRLLWWQPVLDGKQFFTQFLRIRIAAELNQQDRVKTTGELRQRLAAGESIEVSGYRVSPTLGRQLDESALVPSDLAAPLHTDWFEVLQAEDATIAPAAEQVATRLRSGGAAVAQVSVVGPAFWHVHERELAPALIDATTRLVESWGSGMTRGVHRAPEPLPPAIHAQEQPLFFGCGDEHLCGVLHRGPAAATRGVVIVVAGGPQYRVGAHRQFVTLARRVAQEGLPVLRFDLRGMGDSSGEHRGYKDSEQDIRAAIAELLRAQPQVREVVLLGECESASGILFYAWRDARVIGSVLINPWVRTDEGRAQVIVRHYYLNRLLSTDFWKHVFAGRFRMRESLSSLAGVVRAYWRGRIDMARHSAKPEVDDLSALPLPVRVAEGLRRFKGRSLLLMSGNDYIAREFDEVTKASRAWEGLLDQARVQRVDIDGADHTFSREVWKSQVADTVARWLVAS
jgi:exosortase A-associated hydrolase 1/exosortase A-associated hydrolase 2